MGSVPPALDRPAHENRAVEIPGRPDHDCSPPEVDVWEVGLPEIYKA